MDKSSGLLKLEKLSKDIILNSPNGIIVTGEDGIVKFMNDSVEKFFDIEKEKSYGKILSDFIPEFKNIENEQGEIHHITLNNRILHILSFALKETTGDVDKAYLILDIYESSLLKLELSHQKGMLNDFQEILEGSHDGILVTDGTGEVLFVNSSYERVAEIKKEDLYGKNMKDLINPIWMPNSVAFVVIEQKCTVSKKQVTKSGKNIIVTGKPIFDKKGEIKMVVINARDISEIYQLREELLKSQKMEKMYLQNYIDYSEGAEKEGKNILAVSHKMQEVLALAEKVANFQATVLILGESGVGKEEVAKYIHSCSLRKDKHFVTINCGAIPANLLESELFGYEKGAFTGASQSGKEGLLEMADGGVAFLDEIGETPLDFQVKLLRVLETKEIRRVGSVNGKIIDVRIIAATNRNLEEMVEEGTFREDLFYRLNVVKINVPPLRKRMDDIAPLSMLFLARFNKKYGQSKILTYDIIKEMEKHLWHGNVRQLKNVIENMVIVSNNEYLQPEDLPWNIDPNANINKRMINIVAQNEELNLQESLDALEKLILERAKSRFRTTREIADYLQVNQSTIVRKLQKYNL
ncbi:sigma 54-interacting transcriptional regulator [Sinanaerobacter chloroacetimidivorans]|uniref:Sigma 54-interacting transcriptional regulator n=1 Tax=Sinanaerobacter chloroacetimidivorans TaxID=2818044 RepID=A0A8J8B312_9FIRM|nr:sigma 54-interacting transcriptional regulator [Sinanaerobacter chloroacetimidivorans]MBR0597835.1 sigma 54-interacting transcriptional regulator [Sinanaerobacter chloroacetimidivorans]